MIGLQRPTVDNKITVTPAIFVCRLDTANASRLGFLLGGDNDR